MSGQTEYSKIRKGVRFQAGVYAFCRAVIGPWVTRALHFSYKPCEIKSRTFLALGNHTQNLDPALLVIATKRYMRFVANAAITKGFVGLIMNNFFGVIPREKGAKGDKAVALIEANLKAGVSVGMFPEGNRTWDGETEFISPRTARLAKESGAALVTYRFTGGYLLRPRWAKYKRNGPMRGRLVREYSPEELAAMTEEQVYAAICQDLHVNAFEEQARTGDLYPGKNLAEGLEYAAYLCPSCLRIGTIRTSGDCISCECGLQARYLETGAFAKVDKMPFDNFAQWNAFQKKWMNGNCEALKARTGEPIASDGGFHVTVEENGVRKKLSSDASVAMFGDRIELGFDGRKIAYPIGVISGFGTALSGSMYFTVADGPHYQLVSTRRVSLLKYYALWRCLSGRAYI